MADVNTWKVVAFDLDGTLTQHKCKLDVDNRRILERLGQRYQLLIVGAGSCRRIWEQLDRYPLDIIGHYGMQAASCHDGELQITDDQSVPVDRKWALTQAMSLRKQWGLERYQGDSMEFHASGLMTFPLLGTAASLEDKLAMDPSRGFRRRMLSTVRAAFYPYTVFVGGSSSFDIVPQPYNKRNALDAYCRRHQLSTSEIVYIGDDYGSGGNDEDVYRSPYTFLCIEDYRQLASCVSKLL